MPMASMARDRNPHMANMEPAPIIGASRNETSTTMRQPAISTWRPLEASDQPADRAMPTAMKPMAPNCTPRKVAKG